MPNQPGGDSKITIVPAHVVLRRHEKQRFDAVVEGGGEVSWLLSPEIGQMEGGVYMAPGKIEDSRTVTVIARSLQYPLAVAKATVHLEPPPLAWAKTVVLGLYLVAVFCLVFRVVQQWPPNAADEGQRERQLVELVLLAGALGSFVHAARSFADFVGNRSIKGSWGWWYLLLPLIGSTLALIFYLVLRGGLLATGTGPNALNPYGVAALAGLAGMFTKQATNKLDELFSTLFKTDKDRALKDKLDRQGDAGAAPPQ